MKVSIITVCKNSGACIESAIQSVISQKYDKREYIIIDGKSIDNTPEIISKYRNNIDVLISEPDSGIYNAMNKGLTHVSGDIVYFLNADDLLFDTKVLSDIVSVFKKQLDKMVVYGDVALNINGIKSIRRYNNISWRYFYKNTICHQAVFCHKDLYKIIGIFDERYKIHADVDWLMRAYNSEVAKFRYINRPICHYSSQGFSSEPWSAEKYKYDRQEISAKYFLEARIKLLIKRLLKKYSFGKFRKF